MRFISYAQNGEDVLLNRVFADVANGFYVDIGAYDPIDGSVTKAFSDRGWTGINIEPGEIFHRLAAARTRDINLHMAVFDRGGTVTFVQHAIDAGQSHVVQGCEQPIAGVAHEVACDTLAAILTEHAPERMIDFLKIDAEGAEAAIIRSTNWRAIRPTVLVIEATYPWSNQLANMDWEPVLLTHGYKRVWFDGINCFYVPTEREDLLHHFVVPINAVDDWEPFAAAELKVVRAELEAAVAELKVVRAELEAARSILNKLVRELRWRDGPAALRTVLPVARLLRWIARTPVPTAPPGLVSAGPTALSSSPAVQAKLPPRAKAAARRLVPGLYRLVRPILRPIAWRSEVQAELVQLKTKLDRISAVLSVNEVPPTDARELLRMLETTLLTLTLDRRRDGE